MAPTRITFSGSHGEELAARLDLPAGSPRAYALFAHCFSCSKDVFAASRISGQLAQDGIAVLRFDFTGLGNSAGDFANTNFSSNVADLIAAADFLRRNYQAPSLLIGHSLGGAAAIMAADKVPECKAVVTLGAPADTEHVTQNFAEHLDEIQRTGQAEVKLGGRPFTIQKQFVEDLKTHKVTEAAAKLGRALLVMHAPLDGQVGIENASEIFGAAKHPKSFVSLDGADHLITGKEDAVYAANVLCSWAERYIVTDEVATDEVATDEVRDEGEPKTVLVEETGNGKWQNIANASGHILTGDQPKPIGGDSGPGPYDFVAMGLGLCTNQTLRMYAGRKRLPVTRISTRVRYDKIHAEDCDESAHGKGGKMLVFFREIEIEGDLDGSIRERMLEIADKCPVHEALEDVTPIKSKLVG